MPEFDPHAVIKELAEMEQPCQGCTGCRGSLGIQALTPDSFNVCKGAGRIVPFAALRVQRQAWNTTWRGEIEWIPEPDVEKACWRTIESHPEILVVLMDRGVDYEIKEAVLRAAETWVKEQHGTLR